VAAKLANRMIAAGALAAVLLAAGYGVARSGRRRQARHR
jgi:hypothetical protein